MSVSAIQRWLQGQQPIADGVALLVEHGKPTKALLNILNTGERGYARERLVEALNQVLRKAQAAPNASPQPARRSEPLQYAKAALSLIETVDDWPLHRYPVELQEVKRDAARWLAEQDTLMGELRRIPTKEERYRTALRIKELDDMRHAAYYRLDTFRATGTDVGAVTEAPKSLAQLQQELLNIRSYLCKVAKGTRVASPEQLAAWKARRDILQTTIDAGAQG